MIFNLVFVFIAAKEVEELERTGKMPGQTSDEEKSPVNNKMEVPPQHQQQEQHLPPPPQQQQQQPQWATPDMNNYGGGYQQH